MRNAKTVLPRRQRVLYRLLATSDHAHQRSYAVRHIAELLGLERREAVQMVEKYRATMAECWARDQVETTATF